MVPNTQKGFRYAYPSLDAWPGTAIALAASVFSAWVLYLLPRLRKASGRRRD